MRRNELMSTEFEEDFKFITSKVPVGNLGLVDNNGYPRIVPLNFATIDKTIYFHGAKEGEKYELLNQSPKATFSIDMPYAFLPSFFTSEKYACPATHYFKSVHIRGRGIRVDDMDEKASGLQAMMEKYQDEGTYTPISPELSMYKTKIRDVAVFKIIADEITIKIKFGQNETDSFVENLIKHLKKRNQPMDKETIDEILRLRPKNKN